MRKSRNVISKNATNIMVVVHTDASIEPFRGSEISRIPITVSRLICKNGIATVITTRKNAVIRIKLDEPSVIFFSKKNTITKTHKRTSMIPITTELPTVAKSTIL